MNDRNIDAHEPFWATLRKIVTNGGARRMTISHPLSKIVHDDEKKRKADQKRLPPSFGTKMRAILTGGRKQLQPPEKPRPLSHWNVQAAVMAGAQGKAAVRKTPTQSQAQPRGSVGAGSIRP